MAISNNQSDQLGPVATESTIFRFRCRSSWFLWSLLVLGVSLLYAFVLSQNVFVALAILVSLFFTFFTLKSTSNLLVIFPIVYMFTFFSIPGIGSPEKLLGAVIVFILLAKVIWQGRIDSFHLGMGLSFLLYMMAHFPALLYAPENFENNLAGIFSHLSMGVFVYLVVNLIHDQKQIEGCVAGIVALNILIVGFILYLVLSFSGFGFYRNPEVNYLLKTDSFIRFTFMNSPNRLCRVVLMTYPFVILFYLYARSYVTKLVGMLLCIAMPGIVIISYSRMGLITLTMMLPLLYLMFRKRTKLFVFILIFFLIGGMTFSHKIAWRFARLQEQREAYGEIVRLTTWKSAIQGWLDHPLFGVGVGKQAIYAAMEKHGATKLHRDDRTEVPKSPHSVYLNTLLETGAIGFAALALFFYYFIRYLTKSLKKSVKGTYLHDFVQMGLISMLSALIMGLTAISIWLNIFWYIIGILYAGSRLIRTTAPQSK